MSSGALKRSGLGRRAPGRWLAALAAASALALAAAFPGPAVETAAFVAENLLVMLPVVAVATALAAFVHASGMDGLVARVFHGRTTTAILAASLFGALTPICGVGVLPIIAALLGAGVPLAPIMAFWLSSPITDPSMLAITAATLGPPFAVGKTAVAFAIGVIGGLATMGLVGRGAFHNPLRTAGAAMAHCEPDPRGGAGMDWRLWRSPARRRRFREEAWASAALIVKWLTLAFALESLVRRAVPPEVVADLVGADNAWAIPVAVAVGTPIYLDGYAALPLVRGLLDLGMAPGAAMAFLVAGGITSLYASVAVYALVRFSVFLWYVGLAVVGSTIAGYAYAFATAG